jgi:hypothetical protein
MLFIKYIFNYRCLTKVLRLNPLNEVQNDGDGMFIVVEMKG